MLRFMISAMLSTVRSLDSFRWRSLLSLAYNSRSLIGPKLVKAIQSGDWDAAADEIEFKSNAGKQPEQIKRVLQARRISTSKQPQSTGIAFAS